MPITYQDDDVPDLWASELPKEEREQAAHLQSQLQQMATLTDEAASAIALFEHARKRVQDLEDLLTTNPADRITSPQKTEQQLISGWQLMAARALVMAVWRLDDIRNSASTLLRTLPSVAPLVDRRALQAAKVLFDESFRRPADPAGAREPDARPPGKPQRGVRNPARMAPEPAVNFRIEAARSRVTYLQAGDLLQLEIGQQTLRRLRQVREEFFKGFAQVGECLQEAGRHERRRYVEQQSED